MSTPPPKKRLRMTIVVDGHNGEDLEDVFEQVTDWVFRRSEPLAGGDSCASGGGWHAAVVEQDGYTPEHEWRDTLQSWAKENRETKATP